MHTFSRDRALCTAQESPSRSAGGLFPKTHATPWCAFLMGGLVGAERHWPY